MKSIVIIIDYFGSLPTYFPFFLESCKWNPTINWLIHTDCVYSAEIPSNVLIKHMSWDDYRQKVSTKLGITFLPRTAYKLCDLKPAYGYLWKEEIHEYDFWGFGDIDLVYGDIRNFYTNAILDGYDILSVSGWGISGPLCILKNAPWTINAFAQIPGWRDFFSIIECVRFDEDIFFRAFCGPDGKFYDRILLQEQHITPLCNGLLATNKIIKHADRWFWKNGKVTNSENGDREFICIHFMNYISARYMDPSYGETAPWSKLDSVANIDIAKLGSGFEISLNGFTCIKSD